VSRLQDPLDLQPGKWRIPAKAAPKKEVRTHAARTLGKPLPSRYKQALQTATQQVRPSSMSFVFLNPLIWLVDTVLGLYTFVIIAAVVASWLIAFGVLNTGNQLVRQLVQILYALTEPLFRRVRRFIPPIGGLDLSPIVVLIGIELLRIFLDDLLTYLIYRV
jgi:YggT family protein